VLCLVGVRFGFLAAPNGYFCPMAWPRLYHMPRWVQKVFPGWIWHKAATAKTIYLTFDDGPSPEATSWLLETLEVYEAKATFFCVGANAERYPQLLDRMVEMGHQLANHTHHHLDGWQISDSTYVKDVKEAHQFIRSPLFRPPYGKITPSLGRKLKQEGFEVVMWDILTYDFDGKVNTDKALRKIVKKTRPGSIVVFHDHPKALAQLKQMLPAYLNQLRQNGYQFSPL
jgi:peptidoglycan/xylan/chitin deacetylase (PgdA/CDA1 family)